MRRPWIVLALVLVAPAASAGQLDASVELRLSEPIMYLEEEGQTRVSEVTITYRAAGTVPTAGFTPSADWWIEGIPSWISVEPSGGVASFSSGDQGGSMWTSTVVVPVSFSTRRPIPPGESSAEMEVVVRANATATHREAETSASFSVSVRRDVAEAARRSEPPAPAPTQPSAPAEEAEREPLFVPMPGEESSESAGFAVPGPLTLVATTAAGGWAGWRLSRRFD